MEHICTLSENIIQMPYKALILIRSCRWLINQPPLFLLSKTHKNKNKHPGGIIFLPDDQFGCSGQTTQN